MGRIRHEIWTLVKAEASASIASAVDFGLAIGLTTSGLLTYGYANLIGVVSGGLTNFTLNSRYVFAKTGRGMKQLAVRYLMVWLGSMTINGLGTNALTSLIGASYFVLVKCAVAVIVALCFNYPLQRGFVFKGKGETVNGKLSLQKEDIE